MDKNKKCNIDDLLSLFEETISPADVLSSKLRAQVSSIITKERLKLKMTQSQYAKHIDVKQSQISRWEHGDYNFSLDKIADIAAKLNLDINITSTSIPYKTIELSKSNRQSYIYILKPGNFAKSSCNGNNYKIPVLNNAVKEESKHATIC